MTDEHIARRAGIPLLWIGLVIGLLAAPFANDAVPLLIAGLCGAGLIRDRWRRR